MSEIPLQRLDVGLAADGAAPACTVAHQDTTLGGEAAAAASGFLADHTTLRVGGPARRLVVARTTEELVAAVTACDDAGEPVLVLGGGSNVVAPDAGVDGTVVLVATRGVTADVSDCAGAMVTVAAGEPWDALVAHAVAQGWVGLECLSGIPGCVGSSPIQNVGAYGQEVSQTIARVRAWDRRERAWRTFFPADCDFAYRHSVFKREPGRWLITDVTFQLELGTLSAPIAYAELARSLDVEQGQRAGLGAVREAVLGLRRAKGMVLDEADHDTWSAGSFFTNPLLDAAAAAALPPDAPRYPAADGLTKTSAAWLIEHAGFGKGYGTGPATLSTKHTLAITNRGGARTADVLGLAREIVAGVERAYGVTLVPEPVILEGWS